MSHAFGRDSRVQFGDGAFSSRSQWLFAVDKEIHRIEDYRRILSHIKYKPNFTFAVDVAHAFVLIISMRVPNAVAMPGHAIGQPIWIKSATEFRDDLDENSFVNFVLNKTIDLECHECCEQFKYLDRTFSDPHNKASHYA